MTLTRPANRRPSLGRRRAAGRDHGSSTIEIVILMPAVLLLLFGIVQAGLFYNARNTANTAAQVGVLIARAENGSFAQGATATRNYLKQFDSLAGAQVGGGRTANTATITVAVDAPSVLPGLPLPQINASASAPVEAFSQ